MRKCLESKARNGIVERNPHSENTFVKGGVAMSGVGGVFTSTGVILVLFILLVIVSRSFIY